MPGSRTDAPARRGVIAAGRRASQGRPARSLWFAAVWTGVGAAVVCATVAIVVVAILWLPVSGSSGRTHSAIRAGLLSFLAAVHGGITVDQSAGSFLPLGMMIVVGLAVWRAGAALGDTASEIGERDPLRLGLAGGLQAASFAVACVIMVPFATLGTSGAPFLGVGAAALVLCAVAGGTSFARTSELGAWLTARIPSDVLPALRAGAAVVLVYLLAGAVLVGVSLAMHASTVQVLSRSVGGGWSGVPILLLGVLAAPNAVIAGASYLAGPGFAVGAGTSVTPFGAVHGTVPAFPLLGALPSGTGAGVAVWSLVALTPATAGALLARLAWREDGWVARLRLSGFAIAGTAVGMLVLGWQGGGSIGDGRLSALGPSPIQLAGAVAGAAAAATLLALAGAATVHRLAQRDRLRRPTSAASAATRQPVTRDGATSVSAAAPTALTLVAEADPADGDADGSSKLAG